jgi:hypothetical protein
MQRLTNLPPPSKALEKLKMLTQSDLERERYEARRKAQLDHNSMINVAIRKGRYEKKVSLIHSYERKLNRPETPAERLASRPLEELAQLAEDLLSDLLSQRSANG